ncbi:hypothetical protein [Streptomyces smyrnaeus]|uniref:hypothetical protein n=1 Tax=Streptomyces smyrnaeus TaxID=1387713 RepID=UPI0036C71A24
MPAPISREELQRTLDAVYDAKTGEQIRSYPEAAEYLGINKNSLVSRLRRAKKNARAGVNYEKYVPDNVQPWHLSESDHLMLRALAEEEAGNVEIGPQREQQLATFKRKAKNLVLIYDPEVGYYWRKRTPQDGNAWILTE